MTMEKTVIDMMNEISRKMDAVNSADAGEAKKIAIADAELTTKMSKQFFNGADLVIRAENLMAKDGTLNTTRLNAVIGE